jgi:hypothetical protein
MWILGKTGRARSLKMNLDARIPHLPKLKSSFPVYDIAMTNVARSSY